MRSMMQALAAMLSACAMAASPIANAEVPVDVITVGLGGSARNCSFETLREAITYASQLPGPNRIWLSRSTRLGYELPGAALEINNQDLEIVGGFVDCFDETPDELGTDISGNGAPRDPVIRIRGSSNVQLAYLGITLGDADGGEGAGIDYQGRGNLSLFQVNIHNNRNEGSGFDSTGGGILFHSQGGPASLGLTRTTVFDNSARFGGGIFVSSESAARVASVEIGEMSTIRDNAAVSGGGIFLLNNAELRMRQPGARIIANRADGEGGGIYAKTPIRAFIGLPAAAVSDNVAGMPLGSNIALTSGGDGDDGELVLYRQPGSAALPFVNAVEVSSVAGNSSAAVLLASGVHLNVPVVSGPGAVFEMNTAAVLDALPADAERPVVCDITFTESRCGAVLSPYVRNQGRAEIARALVYGGNISALTGAMLDIRDSAVLLYAAISFTGGAGGRLTIEQSTLRTPFDDPNLFTLDTDGELVLRDSIFDGRYSSLLSVVGGTPTLDISRILVRHRVGVPASADVLVGEPRFEGGSTFPLRLKTDSPGIDAAPTLMGFPDPSGVERANDQPGLCGAPGAAPANARDLGAFETPVGLLNDGFGDAVAPQRDYILAPQLAIPDNAQQTARSPLLVAQRIGYPCPPAEVRLQIDHPRPTDLKVNLLAPNGRTYVLYDGTGPINRSYAVDVGLEPLNGEWALEVTDIVTGVSGTLQRWSLKM